MKYTKKIVGTSSAILMTGAIALSSISALSAESDNENTPTSIEASGSVTSSTGSEREQLPEYKKGRTQMKQDIKNEKAKIKQEIKDARQELKQEVKAKKRALSEKLHAQLTVAINALTVEKLSMVLTNIDRVVTKIETSTINQEKKDNFLAQLAEIRVIIQDKIDAITGALSEGNLLNDILWGTNTGTVSASTGTTTDTGTTTLSGTTTSTGTTTLSGTITP